MPFRSPFPRRVWPNEGDNPVTKRKIPVGVSIFVIWPKAEAPCFTLPECYRAYYPKIKGSRFRGKSIDKLLPVQATETWPELPVQFTEAGWGCSMEDPGLVPLDPVVESELLDAHPAYCLESMSELIFYLPAHKTYHFFEVFSTSTLCCRRTLAVVERPVPSVV